jgi:hypothetical protein
MMATMRVIFLSLSTFFLFFSSLSGTAFRLASNTVVNDYFVNVLQYSVYSCELVTLQWVA